MAHKMMKNRLVPFSLIALMAFPSFIQIADARAGMGFSSGSRGSQTYSAPSSTSLSSWSRPMERSVTPPPSASSSFSGSARSGFGASAVGAGVGAMAGGMFARRPAFGASSQSSASMATVRPSFAARHPYITRFAGVMIGAGVIGMLTGHGFLGGIHGLFAFIGGFIFFLIKLALIIWLIRTIWRWFKKKPSEVKENGQFGMRGHNFSQAQSQNQNITLSGDDYRAFQELLVNVQAAWSAQNISALQRFATPEMVGYFNGQLADLTSRGARNIVSDIQFENGELSEAWREGNLCYATVAMRFSMIDVTTDSFGNVIDGSKTERQRVTELWTFLRSEGRGNWILSAIQQAG